MKLLISFFILLISFSTPAQATFAVPAEIGSYSNPIEPIKPKAKNKSYKFKNKPIQSQKQEEGDGMIIFSSFFALCMLVGLILFPIGLGQGLIVLTWVGLGLVALCFAWLLGLAIYGAILDNWGAILPYIISFFGIPILLFLTGLLLLISGLSVASAPIWITGAALLLLGATLLSILLYKLQTS